MSKKVDESKIPPEILAKIKEKASQKLDIDNTELVTAFRAQGGNIFHVHPNKPGYEDFAVERGITVAYVVKSGRIEIATSVQHRVDTFTKKVGTKNAIEHYNAGKTIAVPVWKGENPLKTLQDAFGLLC